jgi:hypothetical protein
MRRKLQALLLLLPLLAGGCVTHQLWTESKLDDWNEPAPSPNLRLFDDKRRDDLLIVYDEYSERRETTRTRAFFLQQNQEALAQHTHPHFVNVRASLGLPPVPVFWPAPALPPGQLYAVTETNSQVFTIFSDKDEMGPYQLPVYADGIGRAERVALTPVAATADAAIIAGFLGYCWLQGFAADGDSLSWR